MTRLSSAGARGGPLKIRRKTTGLIVLALVVIALLIAVPNLIEARKHGNEAGAIGDLKAIGTAQARFRAEDLEGDGKLDYGTLEELAAAGLLDEALASGTKRGYTFSVHVPAATPEYLWMAVANPVEVGETGERHFATNHEGVTFYTTSGPLAVTSDAAMPGGMSAS